MKKILFMFLVTANVFAMRVPGIVNFGQFLNCEIFNDYRSDIRVVDYEYTVRFIDGNLRRFNYICNYNCQVDASEFKLFTGPINSPFVYDATCSARILYVRAPRR